MTLLDVLVEKMKEAQGDNILNFESETNEDRENRVRNMIETLGLTAINVHTDPEKPYLVHATINSSELALKDAKVARDLSLARLI